MDVKVVIHIKVFLNGLKNNVPLDEKILLGLTAAIFLRPRSYDSCFGSPDALPDL